MFAGQLPGKTPNRPALAACLDYFRAGDTLVVPSRFVSWEVEQLPAVHPLADGPDGLKVLRHSFEHRTSLPMNAEQSGGPDRNAWAMFTMTR